MKQEWVRKYQVRKVFIGGLLKGLVVDDISPVPFKFGEKITKPCGGTSPYVVSDCFPILVKARV